MVDGIPPQYIVMILFRVQDAMSFATTLLGHIQMVAIYGYGIPLLLLVIAFQTVLNYCTPMLGFLGQHLLLFYRATSLSWKWWMVVFVALWNERSPKRKHNGKYWSDIREDIEPIRKEIKALSRIRRRLWNNSSYRHPDFRHIQWQSSFCSSLKYVMSLVVGPIVGLCIEALCWLAVPFSVTSDENGSFLRIFDTGTRLGIGKMVGAVMSLNDAMAQMLILLGGCYISTSRTEKNRPSSFVSRYRCRSHALWITMLILVIIPTVSAEGDGSALLSPSIAAGTAASLVMCVLWSAADILCLQSISWSEDVSSPSSEGVHGG